MAPRGNRAGTARASFTSRYRVELTARTKSAGPRDSSVLAGTAGAGTNPAAGSAADAARGIAPTYGMPMAG